MARQGIFTGFTPNDGLGDSLAAGAVKVNDNFLEIYQTFGDGINLSANAGSAGTWAKVSEYGISTSKYVGIGTDLPTSQLHVSGNTLLSGITTGTFVGDGSGLTGVTATGSGVVIKDNGTLIGVAQSINFGQRLDVGQVFGGNVTIDAVDYVSYANLSGVSSYTAVAGYSSVTDYSPLAGVSSYTPNAGVATYAQSAGIVTYSAASGVATNAGVSEYAKLAGVSTYADSSGISTVSGYASTSGIATVAQNLTGTPSITIDNINSAIGIVTMPGQGSKMRFDFDATGDLPTSTSWRGMFAYANNLKRAYVSTGTTMGGYNGWRQILHQDEYGNYFTVGVITASRFSGDGSALTNLPSTDSIWRSNATGINTLGKVGIGTTTCIEALNITGNINLDGRMDGTATNNTLPFLWSTYSSLPQATDYHGQFAHAHDMGKAYFAHAGRWVELVDRAVDGTVGTSTDNYIVGVITATEFSGTISGLTSTANINTTGVITATKFVGDGSGLTNLPGGGGGGGVAGVVVQEEGSTVGTAGTINFVGAGMTATLSAGVATVHVTSSGIQVETDPIFVSSAAYTITGIQTSQWSSAYSWGNHASQGYLSGSSNLDALNNVSSSVPSTNQVLKWSGSEWAPANESGGGGSPAGSDKQIQFNNGGSFGADSSFYFDTSIDMLRAGECLGIGMTSTGSYKLEVNGNARVWGDYLYMADSTFGSLVLENSTLGARIFQNNGRPLQLNPAGVYGGVGIGTTNPENTKLRVEGDTFISGIITAANFSGDGSGLTGVVGSGSGVIVQDGGSTVGTAGTIDFGTGLSVSPISAGVVTVTTAGGGGGTGYFEKTGAGINTNTSVGIGTTNPLGTQTLQIRNTVFASHGVASSSFTASAGTPQEIDAFITEFMTAEYTLHIINGNNYQAQKALVMHTGAGTTAYVSEYGLMSEPNRIADVSVSMSSNVVTVNLVPLTGISGVTTYRFTSQKMI